MVSRVLLSCCGGVAVVVIVPCGCRSQCFCAVCGIVVAVVVLCWCCSCRRHAACGVVGAVATHYFIKVARTTMSLGWR